MGSSSPTCTCSKLSSKDQAPRLSLLECNSCLINGSCCEAKFPSSHFRRSTCKLCAEQLPLQYSQMNSVHVIASRNFSWRKSLRSLYMLFRSIKMHVCGVTEFVQVIFNRSSIQECHQLTSATSVWLASADSSTSINGWMHGNWLRFIFFHVHTILTLCHNHWFHVSLVAYWQKLFLNTCQTSRMLKRPHFQLNVWQYNTFFFAFDVINQQN